MGQLFQYCQAGSDRHTEFRDSPTYNAGQLSLCGCKGGEKDQHLFLRIQGAYGELCVRGRMSIF